ncbi:uncharacterized protein LOC115633472 isoform X2 [Scaptodrosophila lebanonensis]|uniref:Uncharacterized protein LOC115633472 isoform X2 n=1 Tax=Drosophila lebanonensis TaxID=7225 RepID=A0A6J2UEA2_DROLE|nr:uncharacterized protein LOC115633472 isoform X2 [Scaptodrosophila lebanonensis]
MEKFFKESNSKDCNANSTEMDKEPEEGGPNKRISNDKSLKACICKYLCVPATSTESERMFSKAGLIVSEKRSSLKSKNVDMLIFINKNEWISNN